MIKPFMLLLQILMLSGWATLSACSAGRSEQELDPTDVSSYEEAVVSNFQITSPAFPHKGSIPVKYTCVGDNISPPLEWENPPAGTVSYTLIMDDPDAPLGTWVHWIFYNIPSTTTTLEEDVYHSTASLNGALSGMNGWGKSEYGGPCPPSGQHRYFIKLYALDTSLDLKGSVSKADLIKAMQMHILGQTELMGVFKK